MMQPKIHAASAVFPGFFYETACEMIAAGADDHWFGRLDPGHIQLCPQQSGVVTEGVADRLMEILPDTRFRLHASCKVMGKTSRNLELGDVGVVESSNFEALSAMSRYLKSPGYSIHAGKRERCPDMRVVKDKIQRLQEFFECPVAVEGMYPAPGGVYVLSTWPEYAQLLEYEIPFALDLSHLNIVAQKARVFDHALVAELLNSPLCHEVHVSGNDGTRDQHVQCQKTPWWQPILENSQTTATIFSEGIIKMLR